VFTFVFLFGLLFVVVCVLVFVFAFVFHRHNKNEQRTTNNKKQIMYFELYPHPDVHLTFIFGIYNIRISYVNSKVY